MKEGQLLKDQDIDKKIDKYYQWRETFFGKIEEWWNDFLGYKIKDFISSSKSIIRWFPIIWKDRNWDDSYIFEILKQKIKFTSQLHKKNKRFVGVEREIELMDLCVKLIDYIKDEYYEELAHDKLEAKYGPYTPWVFKPLPADSDLLDLEHGSDLHELIIEREKDHLFSEEERDQDHTKWYTEAYTKHNKARKLLFRILEEHIERWWD